MSDFSPATVLDQSDPGDDTIARFKYQFGNVAINAIQMIIDPNFARSIICENFEDFIVEKMDGSFEAVQVKTKARHLPPFRLTDNEVEKSFVRFSKLNGLFPGKFTRFVFTTNHEMWEGKENGANAVWFLSELRETPSIKRLRRTNPKRETIERLAEKANVEVSVVIDAMIMTTCVARKEDISSIERAVSDAIIECDQCASLPYQTVLKLANDLTSKAFHASAKGTAALNAKMYVPDACFEDVLAEVSLQEKMIDRKVVEEILQSRLEPCEEPLDIAGILDLEDLPKGLSKMVQKMANGGVEAVRIKHMTDLVHSLEALEVKWALRFGRDKAKEMVGDLLGRTLTESVEAQVEASKSGSPYGSLQFSEVKRRLEERHKREEGTMYGCRLDHLLGAVGVLTEDCKVWWSEEFDLIEYDR